MTSLKTDMIVMQETPDATDIINTCNIEEIELVQHELNITVYFVSGRIRRYSFKNSDDYFLSLNKLIRDLK